MNPTTTGILSKTPLAHLLMYCLDKKVSGSLILHVEQEPHLEHNDIIVFQAGYPCKIRLIEPIESLDLGICELSIVDNTTSNPLLQQGEHNDEWLSQNLTKRNVLNASSLSQALQLQCKLNHLFKRNGRYSYYHAINLLSEYEDSEICPIDPKPIVWLGIREHASETHIREMMSRVSKSRLRVRTDANITSMNLTQIEQEIWQRLSSMHSTIEELTQSMSSLNVRSIERIVYGLLVTKQIEVLNHTKPILKEIAPQATAIEESTPQSSPKSWAFDAVQWSTPQGNSELQKSELETSSAQNSTSIDQQRQKIETTFKSLEKANFFDILEVSREASETDIKATYFRLVKQWHPDRLPVALVELRENVARIFAKMTEAFQTLTDPNQRRQYENTLLNAHHMPRSENDEVHSALEASSAFMKAEFFMSKNRLVEAQKYAQRALNLEPDEPNHIAVWCWLESMKEDYQEVSHLSELIQKLNQVIAKSPQCERAHLYRGMLFKKQGKLEQAVADFRAVLHTNPKNIDAAREVRLHTMRKEKSGALGRLFKK